MNEKIRVLLITQGVSRIVPPLFSDNRVEIVGVCESGSRKKRPDLLFKTFSFFYPKSLSNHCRRHHVDYFYYKSNHDHFCQWVSSKKPDLIIVYSMSQLLRKEVIDLPEYGVINLHPSYLPYYRGANPWFWQYYDMQSEFGLTLHYLDEGMDTGNIIYQTKYPVPLGMKSPEMHDLAIGKLGNQMLSDFIGCLFNGVLPPNEKQPKIGSSLARNLTPEEHDSIIDWCTWDIERVWHLLRGTELWLQSIPRPDGIYTGQRWIIEGYVKQSVNTKYTVSKIYKTEGRYFLVCRDGVIYLKPSKSLKNIVISFLKLIGV